uniref:Uncharacterized protein n=1 Tax=Anguilla anguilla TaxID=7936 RepID=A0A0E9VDV1_ANGAN
MLEGTHFVYVTGNWTRQDQRHPGSVYLSSPSESSENMAADCEISAAQWCRCVPKAL